MQEGLFTETEQAEAYRAIRRRQPEFNINGFLAEVRRDVPAVLGAYLKGDLEALRGTNISPEMLERMGGQMRVWQSEQQFVDPRILHLSELELVEVRMMDGHPLVGLQFSASRSTARTKPSRSDGAKTTSRRALPVGHATVAQDSSRPTAASTRALWQLREMVLRGMMAVAAGERGWPDAMRSHGVASFFCRYETTTGPSHTHHTKQLRPHHARAEW